MFTLFAPPLDRMPSPDMPEIPNDPSPSEMPGSIEVPDMPGFEEHNEPIEPAGDPTPEPPSETSIE